MATSLELEPLTTDVDVISVPAESPVTYKAGEGLRLHLERCGSECESTTESTNASSCPSDLGSLSETEGDDEASTETPDAGCISGGESDADASDLAGESAGEKAQSAQAVGVFALVAATVLSGCACQAPYEVLNSRDRGCAHLLSFCEHIFGALASLGALRQPRRLPWSLHFGLTAVNTGYTLLLGAAFSTSLPTTVLIAMKNGNLVASMLLGFVVLRRRYALQQYAAVLILSAGLVATSLSGMRASSSPTAGAVAPGADAALGILYLTGALICRAAGGMIQEVSARGYDVSVTELLFYRCVFGLPLILVQWPAITRHAVRWTAQPDIFWPSPWLLLAAWFAADYAMKVCIARLIGRTSSLAMALTLTLQRFVSFLISAAVLSQEPITCDLCVGVVTVLGGTVLYVMTPKGPAESSKKTD